MANGGTALNRALDFIVIGVQKGGTTSLWQYLRSHPEIAMPEHKEAPVFCAEEEQVQARLDWLMRSCFADAPAGAQLGKAATCYMMGKGATGASVELVVERMAAALPEVKLIALLRDPIARAMSQYRMAVRRGHERRDFDAAVAELLEPRRLAASRARPDETNSYLVQGEYGRLLGVYRARFPAERLHLEYTSDLGRDPGASLDRVLAFLGLPGGHRPADLGVRHHPGGDRPRLDPEATAELRAHMEENVWPKVRGGRDEAVKTAFAFNSFVGMWNVVPDDARPALSETNRERLEAHYRADGHLLDDYGVDTPWLRAWTAESGC